MPRSSIPLSFDIGLPSGPGPASSRFAAEIVRAIALGQLLEGDPLPSTRTLASETGIARSTVVAAYEELSAGAFVLSRPGHARLRDELANPAVRVIADIVS